MPIDPHEFRAEYVEPAVELYRKNRLEKHLAVHAISEMNNLAEVVALYTLLGDKPTLEQKTLGEFRQQLRGREPVLGIIHDAHDSHKHGRLVRADSSHKHHDPSGASEGQRPEAAVRSGFFAGVSFAGGPPISYNVLVVRLNDGTEREVFRLLFDAEQAWEREFARS